MNATEKIFEEKEFHSSRNACKVCTPLGTCIAFKGVKGCIPLIHGSQGCSTYIRRYLISHYKEPFDIASTNFSIDSTIFGGGKNFAEGLDNIISQYNPEVIGICTTCLSETIGEDINLLLKEYKKNNAHINMPYLAAVSTPSYQGTHIDGFHETVAALVSEFAEEELSDGLKDNHINIFPGFLSPEDLRHLKEILNDFEMNYVMLPDYSETLDSPTWKEYIKISPGGTSVKEIKTTGSARASIEFGDVLNKGNHTGRIKEFNTGETTGEFLKNNFDVDLHRVSMPVGINLTDNFFELLKQLTGMETPQNHQMERGRLIDSYIDGHKYVMDKSRSLWRRRFCNQHGFLS
jgi:nitrogenase molybdenum-iron protein NifN